MKGLVYDINGNPLPIVDLGNSQNVDGTSASQQSEVLTGTIARIVAGDLEVRIVKGINPTAVTTDILIPPHGELWIPIIEGQKIAVLGGTVNITTANI